MSDIFTVGVTPFSGFPEAVDYVQSAENFERISMKHTYAILETVDKLACVLYRVIGSHNLEQLEFGELKDEVVIGFLSSLPKESVIVLGVGNLHYTSMALLEAVISKQQDGSKVVEVVESSPVCEFGIHMTSLLDSEVEYSIRGFSAFTALGLLSNIKI